ncbi:LuxR C-terminal-related transcriptional regulator [Gymnodinialimonas sp. 2305UL16-5]|uniref:LuxR C-terminal-related transcriptional regulator n=1 Tax=Gymnodinialimonas mytili TaxID=3126503 RepID=UPI0030A355A2
MAADLHIAPSTVRTYLATTYRKLEVSSKVELANRLSSVTAAPCSEVDHASIISELAPSLEKPLSREMR